MPFTRLIALDLDNTTLYDSRTISPGNKRALEDAMAEGCNVAVASGRVFFSLPESVMTMPGLRYAVTSNGAAVYKLPEKFTDYADRMKRARRLRKCMLPPDRVDAVMDIMDDYPSLQYPVSFETFIGGRAYGYSDYVRNPVRYGASPAYIDYVRKTRTMVDDIRAFIRAHREELDGIDMQVGPARIGDTDLVDVLRKRLADEAGDIYITSSVPNRIETANINAGKASGLRYLMNILGISAKETAAFGDADNDIDMLVAAGTGIAVRNGSKKCREAADYVTKACRDDGVAYAIHKKLGFTDRTALMEKYMRAALAEARKAETADEVPVGCVIVRDGKNGEPGKIIARGYNRRNTDRNVLSHAETIAVGKACRRAGDWRLSNCTLYVTLEPCPMCAGAILQARIPRVVIGCMSPNTGFAGSAADIFRGGTFGHRTEVVRGVLEQDCSSLLSGYFEKLRNRPGDV